MDEKRQTKEQLEEAVNDALRNGEMEQVNPDNAARQRLSPRYEIRVEAKMDPIVEETRIYRKIATEIDDRYETYLQKAKKRNPPNE